MNKLDKAVSLADEISVRVDNGDGPRADANLHGTVVNRVFKGRTEVGAIYNKRGAVTFAAHWDAPSDIPFVSGSSIEELKTKLRALGLRVE